jgi:DNA-binding GntR family transcriptional regulator
VGSQAHSPKKSIGSDSRRNQAINRTGRASVRQQTTFGKGMERHVLNFTIHQNIGNLEKRRSVLQDHKEIFARIEKRDAQRAVACLKQHLKNVCQKLLELKE